jgi:hypothetical protein
MALANGPGLSRLRDLARAARWQQIRDVSAMGPLQAGAYSQGVDLRAEDVPADFRAGGFHYEPIERAHKETKVRERGIGAVIESKCRDQLPPLVASPCASSLPPERSPPPGRSSGARWSSFAGTLGEVAITDRQERGLRAHLANTMHERPPPARTLVGRQRRS